MKFRGPADDVFVYLLTFYVLLFSNGWAYDGMHQLSEERQQREKRARTLSDGEYERVVRFRRMIQSARKNFGSITEQQYPDSLILALITRESSGRVEAFVEDTNALGILQIREVYLEDAQLHGFRSDLSHRDMVNPSNSVMAFFHVMEKYSHLHQYDTERMALLHFAGSPVLEKYVEFLRQEGKSTAVNWLHENHPKSNLYREGLPVLQRQWERALQKGEPPQVASVGFEPGETEGSFEASGTPSQDLNDPNPLLTFVPTSDARSYGFEYPGNDVDSTFLQEGQSVSDMDTTQAQPETASATTTHSTSGYSSDRTITSEDSEAQSTSAVPQNETSLGKSLRIFVEALGSREQKEEANEQSNTIKRYVRAYSEGKGLVREFQMNIEDFAPADMQWPLETYRLENQARQFGADRDDRIIHFGVDLTPNEQNDNNAPPVYTMAPGRVIRVEDQTDRYGRVVYIEHGNGVLSTRYAHLKNVFVSEGDEITTPNLSRPIGRAGTYSSGGQVIKDIVIDEPHIHFEVRFNTQGLRGNTVSGTNVSDEYTMAVNPMPILMHLRSPTNPPDEDSRQQKAFAETFSKLMNQLRTTEEFSARVSVKNRRDRVKARLRGLRMSSMSRRESWAKESEYQVGG